MSDVISEYQKWKEQGDGLRAKAKQAMESRFRELLSDAIAIARDYHADFGVALKPPPSITAFRYRINAKPKPKKASNTLETPAAKPNGPKVAALQRSLGLAKNKLEAAKQAGKPTKNLEDKVYEIEDDLRLALG